jgi:hypothetical protein
MAGLNHLMREYELRHFPPGRRLDLHGEGPLAARQRALRWIQSFAHEQPGEELLLIVERGRRPGARAGILEKTVVKLLEELEGKLIDWWQPFGPGSLAVKISLYPRMQPLAAPKPVEDRSEGRTPETAGALLLSPQHDIPEELLPTAQRAAELRRMREGISVGMLDAVLRRIWIEAQAAAMMERVHELDALQRILREEERRAYEDE